MTDESTPPPRPEPIEAQYPNGHLFPDELLAQWVQIPSADPITVGPLTREDLDHLLFSIRKISQSIEQLAQAMSLWTGNQPDLANIAFLNSGKALKDGETHHRLLFEAIMKSVLKVRNERTE